MSIIVCCLFPAATLEDNMSQTNKKNVNEWQLQDINIREDILERKKVLWN